MEKDFLITHGNLVSLSVPVCWQSSRQNVYFHQKKCLINDIFYQSTGTKKRFNFIIGNDAEFKLYFWKGNNVKNTGLI